MRRAAQGRFHLENPDRCASPEAFEAAVADGADAESTLAKLLMRDPAALAQAREAFAANARTLSQEWKSRPAT